MRRFLLVLAALAAPATAKWLIPTDVPVDRLVKNVGAHVNDHPNDAHGHYVLGRIHGLALTQKSTTVRAYLRKKDGAFTWRLEEADGLPQVDHQFHGRTKTKGAAADPALRKHLDAALKHLREAIRLDPKNGLYHLGLAYVLEAGRVVATRAPDEVKLAPEERARLEKLVLELSSEDPDKRARAYAELRRAGSKAGPVLADKKGAPEITRLMAALWTDRAVESYWAAFELSRAEDAALVRRPLRGLRSLVSHEAAEAYVRLMKNDNQRVAEAKKHFLELKGLPRGPITPIIFSLEGPRDLPELLAPGREVRFDLDGDGVAERRPWVRAGTAILVWDPGGEGKITSGRQLFGSVTWWMFWRNGYEALDALDDDRDGWLTGDELRGLAVWRDADSDGVSGRGEVRPIRETGIAALATKPVTQRDGCPAHPRGLVLDDGRRLPTYDWIVTRSRG